MEDIDQDEHLSMLESSPEPPGVPYPYKQDKIHSGESKFKYYSFEPGTIRTSRDIEKCIDFWSFINNQTDLMPQRGSKIGPAKSVKENDQEETINWTNVLDLLKAKKLDKVAKVAKTYQTKCKIIPCNEEIDRVDSNTIKKSSSDDFDLQNLNEYNPQKLEYADAQNQTDEIIMKDASTDTDLSPSTMRLQTLDNDIAQLLKETAEKDLTGYFDCICSSKHICPLLPGVKLAPSSTSEKSHKDEFGNTLDKCICSCGNMDCLCSLCDKILKEIENAQESFNALTTFEVESCACTDMACACLADYKLLFDMKLEINKAIMESIGESNIDFNIPLRCQCSCNQLNCGCKILTNLFIKLDELMGYKEKPLYYKDKKLSLEYEVDVCRCIQGEDDKLPCSCLNFYRQFIQDKIDLDNEGRGSEIKLKSLKTCKSSCSNTCADDLRSFEVCEDYGAEYKSASNQDVSDESCYCAQNDCLKSASDSESVLLIVSYSEGPSAPPNSLNC